MQGTETSLTALTAVADGIVAGVGVRVPRLVDVQVHRPHAHQVAPAVGPCSGDGVADAAVGQPARAAHVHAVLPGQVQLPRGGQPRSQAAALVECFLEGELLGGGGVEDFACKQSIRQHRDSVSGLIPVPSLSPFPILSLDKRKNPVHYS